MFFFYMEIWILTWPVLTWEMEVKWVRSILLTKIEGKDRIPYKITLELKGVPSRPDLKKGSSESCLNVSSVYYRRDYVEGSVRNLSPYCRVNLSTFRQGEKLVKKYWAT